MKYSDNMDGRVTVFTLNIQTPFFCFLQTFEHVHSILLPFDCLNIAGRVVNRIDTDQTPRVAASDLSLQCLLKHVCLNVYSAFDIWVVTH